LGPPEPVAPPRPPDAARPVLLIVEDNPDVVEYLSACLAKDYQLEYAYNGQAGIEKALELIPDIIISDVMMPEKDGFEVCDTLKHDERSSHIPLVLLTARAAVEDRIAGLRRGADAFLAKPFHPEELQVVLANLLELRRQLQARYSLSAPRPEPSAAPPADPEDAFLQKLQAVVESRLAQADLSVEEISRLLGMSYPVVHRKVTALTGRSLTLYVRLLRLLQARLLLADPALSVADVAYETGFNDPKFFSRVFSEEFGMSPTAFRQRASG
ncbi:MAG: response regulator, partial [Saprospiraceae bacterium]|nr:response regulator [Saprospiraceae bacterium]